MPDPIEAVRADRAELLEIVGDLFFDCTAPTRKSAPARARSRFGVPRGLIAGTLAATNLGRRFSRGYLGIHRTPPDADGRRR